MPIKPKRFAFTPVTQSATNIRTASGATTGVLVVNGALVSGGVVPSQTLAYILLLTTTAADQARNITIVGTDADGDAQTETISLPNATTKVTTLAFRSVTSITLDAGGALIGNLSIGTANTTLSAYSPTVPVDVYSAYTTTACDVTGTINFTVQKCFEMMNRGETPNWVTAQAAGAVDVSTLITGAVSGVRLQINSYTNTATIAMSVLQSAYDQ